MLVVLHGLLPFLFVLAPVFSNAQQGNFISIDCGTEGTSYTDEETGIFYSSDADYIFTGENRGIAPNLLTKSTMKPFVRTVRTFPKGNRNCYTLKPITKGSKYLVRAWFMYGNIDGTGKIPKFDVYVGAKFWHSVDQNDAEEVMWIEIITISKNDFLSVCLVRRKGNGNPYISALELRPLEFDMYNVTTESLVLKERFDLGSATNKIVRYILTRGS